MGAVVSLQEARLKRADQRAARKANHDRERVDHFAHLQGQFQASICPQQAAREFAIVQADLGRHFSDLTTHSLQGAVVYMSGWAAATALAGSYLKHSIRLLHFGLSLVARPSLQRGASQCSGTATRTRKQQTAENFGEGI